MTSWCRRRAITAAAARRRGDWCVKRPAMVGGRDGEGLQQQMVAGGRLLCWVRRHGLIFCNVLDEAPVLRRVPFPPVEEEEGDHPLLCRGSTHDARIAADGTVRLVAVHPRCCCGGSGATHCRRSSNAYTIRTWTLSTDTMAWAMDAMVDATELWALDAAKALPRAQPAYPIIVSADEPHLVFFIVCESFHTKKNAGDGTEWMILVDTRSKDDTVGAPLRPGMRLLAWKNLPPQWPIRLLQFFPKV